MLCDTLRLFELQTTEPTPRVLPKMLALPAVASQCPGQSESRLKRLGCKAMEDTIWPFVRSFATLVWGRNMEAKTRILVCRRWVVQRETLRTCCGKCVCGGEGEEGAEGQRDEQGGQRAFSWEPNSGRTIGWNKGRFSVENGIACWGQVKSIVRRESVSPL